MAFILDKVSEDTFYENMLLGLTKILERSRLITNIHLQRNPACSFAEIVGWEQLHGVKMPEDMKSFFLATNGIKLTYSYIFSEQEILEVGLLHIRELSDIYLLPKCNLQVPQALKSLKNRLYLPLNTDHKILYLADIDETSKVCLVYGCSRQRPFIYLVEHDTYCYYLTNDFKKYLNMAIAHLGLPLWQYCFTPQGVPSWVEQVFIMMAPHLDTCAPITKDPDEDEKTDAKYSYLNKLDSSIFRIKRRTKVGESIRCRKRI